MSRAGWYKMSVMSAAGDRERSDGGFERILVAVEGSEPALEAARVGARLARAGEARLTLVGERATR
jgi:hypothetical protein